MAYFEGNALYIAGGQNMLIDLNHIKQKIGYINFEMDSCVFEKNYGLNIAYGSAMTIDGRQN
jgi:hypothetical protein